MDKHSIPDRKRAAKHGAFAIIPAAAVHDKQLSDADFRKLAAVALHANGNRLAWPKQENIAEVMGVSQQAISKALAHCEACGYVKSRQLWREKGMRAHKVYQIILDQGPKLEEIPAEELLEAAPVTTPEVVAHVTTPEVVTVTTPEVVTITDHSEQTRGVRKVRTPAARPQRTEDAPPSLLEQKLRKWEISRAGRAWLANNRKYWKGESLPFRELQGEYQRWREWINDPSEERRLVGIG